MIIRRLESKDLPLYKNLRLLSLETDQQAFHLRLDEAHLKSDQFFLEEITDPTFGCFGVFEGETLVGMVTLKSMGHNQAQIFTLYVKPDFRKKGLAPRLINHCLSEAKRTGIETCRLTVMKNNPVAGLYRKLGFVEKERLQGFPGEVLLEKSLKIE